MDDEIVCDGYVEVYPDGSCLAQLLDLPGCHARAESEAEALDALGSRIVDYYSWLGAHDEYAPQVRGHFRVETRERCPAVAESDAGAGSGAFFGPDANPISDEDLDWYLALLEWSLGDIVARVETELASGGPYSQHAEEFALEAAQRQLWLISQLTADGPVASVEQLSGTSLHRLRQVARASAARLRKTSDNERERVVERDGVRWSLRKVLRRSVLSAQEVYEALERRP